MRASARRAIAIFFLVTILLGCRIDEKPVYSNPIADGNWFRPAIETSWQWQLVGTVNTSYNVEVYDIDLINASPELIANLHSQGKKVICYFSAGTVENFRPDAARFKPIEIGKVLDDFPDERWLDIRSPNVGQIILSRLDLAVQKHCDGVEPDNVDGYVNNTGFHLTYEEQLAFNRFIANEAHKRGLSVALKNDLDQIPDLVFSFDFSINEQCHEFNECNLLQPFIEQGKPIFNAEYNKKYLRDRVKRKALCKRALAANIRTLILPKNLDNSFRFSCNEE
ncbi:endo alpha-1,4 polygalactosaminidase [Hydrococcus rivularis NIES-593]|uniref:Endo alpha-1,4 polygalactosaminidase n=2 Tax=Hydrococcus TaxID=1616833 RepID=A0A1U7HJP8_9CYAN|nr:endo alpha-1,4 polygalactosaminidase [Hydrococcus rivularis NIES-593]